MQSRWGMDANQVGRDASQVRRDASQVRDRYNLGRRDTI